jgi:DNA-binding NarL/FixJ family response regulator
MLTSEATRKQLDNALAAAVRSFLAKPVGAETLRQNILQTMNTDCEFQKRGKIPRPVYCSRSPRGVVRGEPALPL